jgi:hypothetical protein
MIATLAFLSLATSLSAHGMQGSAASEFPQPQLQDPSYQLNRKIFTYIPEGFSGVEKPFAAPLDWSREKIPDAKPGSQKLLIKILVLERDFSDLSRPFSLEDRDKQRLLQACFRLPSTIRLMTNGDFDGEVVPQFIADPVFNSADAFANLEKDINEAKFDADDSVVRGPFDAVVGIDSKNLPPLGNQGADVERFLYEVVSQSVRSQLYKKLTMSGWTDGAERGNDFFKLGKTNRTDTKALSDWFRNVEGAPLRIGTVNLPESVCFEGAAKVTVSEGDVLEYSEESILRSGQIAMPELSSPAVLKFEYKTSTPSPLAFIQGDRIGLVADASGQTISDDMWHEGFVSLNPGAYSIGVPPALRGTNRTNSRPVKYSLRNFSIVTGISISAPLRVPTEIPAVKLKELALGSVPVGIDERLGLVKDSASIQPAVAYYSVLTYGKSIVTSDDLEAKAFIQSLLRAAPSEAAREAALEVVAQRPELGTFELVSPNLIRKSWRVRLAATKAMGALGKTDFKARPASRELLLSASFQDYASIRSAALSYLDPKVENEKKRLEYGVLNDPSESIRLQCLASLIQIKDQTKEVLFSSLADESWFVRMNALGLYKSAARPELAREASQRLVVDQDPYVRATALKFLAENFKDVQLGEIQSSFIDEHPAVQFSLVTGAKLSGWKLPKETIMMLKKSVSKGVRILAESL